MFRKGQQVRVVYKETLELIAVFDAPFVGCQVKMLEYYLKMIDNDNLDFRLVKVM